MGTITFDTLSFTRKLRDAGFDESQAEAGKNRGQTTFNPPLP